MSLFPFVIAALVCVASGRWVTSGRSDKAWVTTRLGVVEGVTTAAEEGEFYSFKGIPFAKPPVGELRLKVGFIDISKLLSYSCLTRNLNIDIPFPHSSIPLQNPEPAEAWEGVLDASAHPAQCIQVDTLALQASGEPEPAGSEDCLYLNVFAPKVLEGIRDV